MQVQNLLPHDDRMKGTALALMITTGGQLCDVGQRRRRDHFRLTPPALPTGGRLLRPAANLSRLQFKNIHTLRTLTEKKCKSWQRATITAPQIKQRAKKNSRRIKGIAAAAGIS